MPPLRRLIIGLSAALMLTSAAHGQSGRAAGEYRGAAMEVAAGLDLREDGRFDYWLSYGALDETAAGRWRQENGRILLDSDPFVPPSLTLVSVTPQKSGLEILLDLPAGFSRQYFTAEIRFRDGGIHDFQLSEEGLSLDIDPANPPVSVRLMLPIFEVGSEAVTLDGTGGWRIAMTFEPNELGRVAFAGTPLLIDGDTLVLERHDRRIRFEHAE